MTALIHTYWWVFMIALLIVLVLGYRAWAGRTARGDTSNGSSAMGSALESGKATAAKVAGGAGEAIATAAATARDVGASAVTAAHDGATAVATGSASVVAAAKDGVTAAVSGGAEAVQTLVSSRPKIAAAIGAPDDLLKIKGIGPKLNALCQELGITRFDQIAKWGPDDIAEVDQHLGNFRGRVVRDGWIEQAGLLAAGDIAAFEAKFGKLDSENK